MKTTQARGLRRNTLARAARLALVPTLPLLLAAPAAMAQSSSAATSTEKAEKAEVGTIQEVVVTAQKRATLASKTPVSLSVLGGDDLKAQGAADTKRLAELSPNVQLSSGALGGTEVSIRGIGSTNNTEVGDPAVGVSIDGVYLGRPQMAGAALYDIERVEILRGPQGTLYGRNSTAGAINIISRQPVNRFEASAGAGLSTYGGRQFDAMVNAPVSDSFALRGVISTVQHDGYLDTAHAPANNFGRDKSDLQNVSARLLGKLKLGASGSVVLAADMSNNRGAGPGAVDVKTVQAHATGSEGRYVPTSRYEGSNRDDSAGVSAEWKQGLGATELTVLGAHRTQERELIYSVAQAGTGAYNFSNFTQDSLEARLASSGEGALQWVGGAYFFRERGSPIVLGAFGPSLMFFQDPMVTRSAALFGQASYAVQPNLRLTAGLRETHDEKSRRGCTYSFAALNAAGLNGLTDANKLPSGAPDAASLPGCATASLNDAEVSYNKLTYRLGIDWDLDANTLIYASYATGFKAGGFNDGNLATAVNRNAVVYKPELLSAIEVGFKGRYLQRRLQINASLFSYRYDDLQLSAVTTCLNGSGNCTVTQNAARAKSTGMEVEGKWQLTPDGRVNFGLGLTDAHYTRFTTTTGADWSGHKLDKAPRSVLNLGYTHQWTLGSGAIISAAAGLRYSSSYHVSNAAIATHFEQGAFHKTDLSLSYASADDHWSVQLYARNLEDRNTITAYQRSGVVDGVYLAEPRVVGVRGSWTF